MVVKERLNGVSNVLPDAELGIPNLIPVAISVEAEKAAGTDVIGAVASTMKAPFEETAGSCGCLGVELPKETASVLLLTST